MDRNNLEWRDIEGFEDQYQVSNYGDFHIKEYFFVSKDGRKIKRKEKYIMSEDLSSYGGNNNEYLGIHLGGMKKTYAHILAAKAFIANPMDNPEVNHINGNKRDNYCGCREFDYADSNLEWVTRKGNMRHAIEKGLMNNDSLLRKEVCRNNQKKSILSLVKSVVQLDMNGNFICIFNSIKEASEKTGICKTTIGNVCNHIGHYKTAGGYVWVWQAEYDNQINYKPNIDQGSGSRKSVAQFDLKGNMVAKYRSCMEVEASNEKYSSDYVGECCRGIREIYRGFKWKYIE